MEEYNRAVRTLNTVHNVYRAGKALYLGAKAVSDIKFLRSRAALNKKPMAPIKRKRTRASLPPRKKQKYRVQKNYSGGGVTVQHDVTTQYRRKKMPRFKKRRYRKSYNLFKSHLLKSKSTRSQVFNNQIQANAGGANQQLWCTAALYGNLGVSSGSEVGFADMSELAANEGLVGGPSPVLSKYLFSSAVLDLTYTNIGGSTNEVDVYVIYYNGKKLFTNFNDALTQAETATPVIGTSGILRSQRGVTPFELPQLLRFGFKIYSKKKYLVRPGESFTYQKRDPRNRYYSTAYQQPNSAFDKKTHMILFVTKSVDTEASPSCRIGVTRTYKYKIADVVQVADGYDNVA